MSFLVIQILGLLAFAAICGGMFVYWWLRRDFVDVSVEHRDFERAKREAQDLRAGKAEGDARIAALEADKAQLEARLSDELGWRRTIEAKLDHLEPVSLEPVIGRLEGLGDEIGKMRPTDVSGVEERLGKLYSEVARLENTDVSGIRAEVATASAAIAGIQATDLGPVEARLASMEKRVASLHNTDLSPLDARVQGLVDSVARVQARVDALPETDLSAVQLRLDAIEKALESRPTPATEPSPRTEARRQPAGALLDTPVHGKPDDLKRIKGVGPKLEKMLHDIGVYYFFQVGAWTPSDVTRVDDLLQVFKGRIQRDDWVNQARTLARGPGAATMR